MGEANRLPGFLIYDAGHLAVLPCFTAVLSGFVLFPPAIILLALFWSGFMVLVSWLRRHRS